MPSFKNVSPFGDLIIGDGVDQRLVKAGETVEASGEVATSLKAQPLNFEPVPAKKHHTTRTTEEKS